MPGRTLWKQFLASDPRRSEGVLSTVQSGIHHFDMPMQLHTFAAPLKEDRRRVS